MKLPIELEKIIEQEFEHTSLNKVAKSVLKVRENYRAVGNSEKVKADDIKSYVAYRIPGTFAAVTSVLTELRNRHPQWSPQSVLDIGSGPGTTLWAALEIWPAIKHAVLIEQNKTMIDLGKKLAQKSSSAVLRNATWQQKNILNEWPTEKFDLVVMSYTLSEIPDDMQEKIIKQCWESTAHTLCIIEPAKSPRGPEVIQRAGNYLYEHAAKILAPWPEPKLYALPNNRWLHFAQRVERSRLQRLVKGTFRSYEDEKFSYVIASRHKGLSYQARVILQPKIKPGRVELELFTKDGLEQVVITKKANPEGYRAARKLGWGDSLDRFISS